MSRIIVIVAALGVVAGACQRAANEKTLDQPPSIARDQISDARITNVTGCLTGSGDRFMLTELEPGATGTTGTGAPAGADAAAAPVPTTDVYRLVGSADQLQPLVGKRVRVSGAAKPDSVVDIRGETPPAVPPSTATGTTGAKPEVSTAESAHMNIRDLQVQSVTPTGDDCLSTK